MDIEAIQMARLRQKKQSINDELKVVQLQLETAEKKLESLHSTLKFTIGFCLVPFALALISGIGIWISSSNKISDQVLGHMFFGIVWIINFAYLFFIQPLMLYQLVKTLFLIKANKADEDIPISLPKQRPNNSLYREPFSHEETTTYELERRKLMMVLNKYFLHLEGIEKLETEIAQGLFIKSDEELTNQLEAMSLYISIPPATPFGKTEKKYHRLSIFFLILAHLAFAVLVFKIVLSIL